MSLPPQSLALIFWKTLNDGKYILKTQNAQNTVKKQTFCLYQEDILPLKILWLPF